MKKLLLLAFAIYLSAMGEQGPNQSERELMAQIYRSVRDMPVLTSINFGNPNDINLINYKEKKRWFKRDCEELFRSNPQLEKSTNDFGGFPFSQVVEAGRKAIDQNDAFIAAEKQSRPNPSALEILDLALFTGKAGALQIKTSTQSFEILSELYDSYSSGKQKAAEIDPRVLEYRKSEIALYDVTFAAPFMKLKKDRESAEQIEQETADAVKKKKQAEHQKRWREKMDYAKKEGFKSGAYSGITYFVEELADEFIKLDEASSYLIFPLAQDDYTVQNLDSTFVFFIDDSRDTLKQIALIREPNEIYSQGADLPDGEYQFIKFADFTTLLGTGIQIPVFVRSAYDH